MIAKIGNNKEIIPTLQAELEICLFSEFSQSELHADELAREMLAEQAPLLQLALQQLKQYRYFEWQGQNYQPLLQTQLHTFLTLLNTLYAANQPQEDRQNQRCQRFSQL